jgi:hypothetical protein
MTPRAFLAREYGEIRRGEPPEMRPIKPFLLFLPRPEAAGEPGAHRGPVNRIIPFWRRNQALSENISRCPASKAKNGRGLQESF